MKNNKIMRIRLGIKELCETKWKVLFLIIYFFIMFFIWKIGNEHLSTFNYLSLPKLYTCIFGIFMFEITVIGMMLILSCIGTPMKSAEIEQALYEVGFVDNKGNAPMLVSRKKDKKGLRLEFYSPRLPFYKYEDFTKEIETAMNIKVVSVEQGKDKQHVILRGLISENVKRDIIEWKDSYLSDEDFELVLGENDFGRESIDISSTPHILIGGGTGSGKSKLLKLILMQCIKKGAIVYLADFKGGVDYPKIWHERCSIITKAEAFEIQLTDILEILEERRALFVKAETPNIAEYNAKTNLGLNRIVVAIDEIAEVLDKTGLDKEEKALVAQIEGKLSTIARQGRAFGIHLVLATQRPDAEILKGQIKNNISYRVCGRADKVLSQIILDSVNGAEKISPNDKGTFVTNNKTVFKAYYVEEDCFGSVMKYETI